MNSLGGITTTLLGLGGIYATIDYQHIASAKDIAFGRAGELSNGKGIINIGAGPHRTYQAQLIAESPEVLVNVDITPDGIPWFVQLDIEREVLPFADKQFGCALLSHVLEHLSDWQFALDEASRVADNVVIVLPHPQYLSGWLDPDHRQHFSIEDMREIRRVYPEVVIYC